MPLVNPTYAIKHLYPQIKDHQYRFMRAREGIKLEWLDPALGTPPTLAELEAAEIAYQGPSYLDGGTREPTTAELEVNPTLSILYYMLKVQDHVNSVAASFNFGNSSLNPRTRQLEFSGDINNIAKYMNRQTGQNGALARQLETWNDSVWTQLRTIQTEWQAGNITAPTWAELLAQLPAAPAP